TAAEGPRVAARGVRGGPARHAGLEAAAAHRPRLRRPGLAAVCPGELRGRRVLAGGAFEGRGFPRGGPRCGGPPALHVPEPGGETRATLRDLATLAPGSTVAMTFLLPLDLVDERDRQGWVMSENGARSSGTPFISFFRPEEFLDLARAAGFRDVRHVPGRDLN